MTPKEQEVPAEGETAVESAPEEDETAEVAKTDNANSESAAASDRLFSDKPILHEKLLDYEIDLAVNARENQSSTSPI